MSTKKKQTGFWFSDEAMDRINQLKHYAIDEGISVSVMVERFILEGIAKYEEERGKK